MSTTARAPRASAACAARPGPAATVELGPFTVTLYGDGTTGVRLTAAPLPDHPAPVTAHVRIGADDTIGTVTGVEDGTGRPLSCYQRALAGHAALRAAWDARRQLRAIRGAHKRPRRPAAAA